MSKEKPSKVKPMLDKLIDKDMPEIMNTIMADAELPTEVKAARVNLANTALHHLKLLRSALG